MRQNTPKRDAKEKICIIGSGLVGTLLSTLLAQTGFEVDVYEKRQDPREDAFTRGRSIAMSISERGWSALRQAGLEEEIRNNTNPKHSRMVHHIGGLTQVQHYGKDFQTINTINRRYLNITLIRAATKTGNVQFFFNCECSDVNPDTGDISITNTETHESFKKMYTRIIAADGIFSSVREMLSQRNLIAFERTTVEHGYKELRIPPKQNGKYALPNHHVHVWPRKNSVLIALPTLEKNFICTLFLPMHGQNSIESITTESAMMSFFEENFPDVIALMPNLKDDFFDNPASSITQVKGAPWNYKGRILLIGDACHSVAPFYAMGMNVGFEDCTFFMDLLTKNNFDFDKTFEMFSQLRKPHSDAIADLSLKNFQSISESPDPSYHYKWQLERKIWDMFPNTWTPAYVLIAFSTMPLARVVDIIKRQDQILEKIMASNTADISDERLRVTVKQYVSGTSPDPLPSIAIH